MTLLRQVDASSAFLGDLVGQLQAVEALLVSSELIPSTEKLAVMASFNNRRRMMIGDLHMAAHRLHPLHLLKLHSGEVHDSLDNVFKKFFPNPSDYLQVHSELVSSQETLASSCLLYRQGMSAHHWWKTYGSRHPHLFRVAYRLLSKPSSSSACERNWSQYQYVHSKLRNRLSTESAMDLVYIYANSRFLRALDKTCPLSELFHDEYLLDDGMLSEAE